MKYELTDGEKSYINEIDQALSQLQAQRLGALQVIIRSKNLKGDYTYKDGFLEEANNGGVRTTDN